MTSALVERPSAAPDTPQAAQRPPRVAGASPRRHLAWLAGGLAGGFLVPFVLADQIGIQRDVYYGLYALSVAALFAGWARDTGYSLRAAARRRPRLTAGLTLALSALAALAVTRAEDAGPHPDGVEFVAALLWRGVVYGATDGVLLVSFPILVVFAALGQTELRRRRGGLAAVAALALAASMLMTATYHLGYEDFRSDKLARPMSGDLIWGPATLVTLNPVAAPVVHATAHVTAVTHDYDSDLFLPPH